MPRKPPKKKPTPPKLLYPRDFNVAVRGELFQVVAVPLTPARSAGHPFFGKKAINITRFVESVSWSSSTEEAGAVTGNITIRNPGNYLGILVAGSRIIVKQVTPYISSVGGAGKPVARRYIPVLDLIVNEREKQVTDQLLTMSLADRLTYLNKDKRDFNNVKKKGRKGPTASSIIRKVCKEERIPFTKESVPTTTIELAKASASGSTILAYFTKVLKLHNAVVDKRNKKNPPPVNWDIHMRTGVLTIRPKRPPKSVWFLSESNFVGQPSYRESTKKMATRVVATGKGTTYKEKKNKDGTTAKKKKAIKNKLRAEVTNEAMAAVYGLITHTEKVAGRVTQDKLRRVAASTLAKKARIIRELSFTCPALPDIWPAGSVYLHLPSYGMKGVFTVKAVEVSVTGQDGPMMTVTVDAGSVSITAESGDGKALAVTGIRRPDATTVKVFYSGGFTQTYKHQKGYKVAKAFAVTAKNAKSLDLTLDDVGKVVVQFVNKKRHEIPAVYSAPKGIVSIGETGYIDPAGSNKTPLAVTGLRRPTPTSVKIIYLGGASRTYQHPKGYKILTVKAVTEANAAQMGRDPVDDLGVVEVRFVNGRKQDVRPLTTSTG